MGLLDSVSKAVKKVFGSDDRRNVIRERASQDLADADFSVLSVEELLALDRDGFGNDLHVVSLRRFRTRIGDDTWAHYAEKVVHHSEEILRNNLAGLGSAGWQAPDTLVLTFPNLDPETASGIARMVVVQLMKKLIGERFMEGDEPPIDLLVVKTDTVFGANGRLDPERLDGAIASEVEILTNEVCGTAEEGQLRRNEQGLEMRRMRREKALAGDWLPLEWPPSGIRQGRKLIVPKRSPADALGDNVGLAYLPVLNVERGIVDRYQVIPIDTNNGAPIQTQEVGRRMTIDLATVFFALEELEARMERSDHRLFMPSLVIPIAFATAQGDRRTALRSVLKYFPDAVRSRYLEIEIASPDPHTAHSDLRDTHNFIGNHSRTVMWRITPESKALIKPLAGFAGFIGCTTAEWAASRAEAAATLMANLTKAAGSARSFCWGVADARLVEVARNQKCALLTGQVVGSPLSAPPEEAPSPLIA